MPVGYHKIRLYNSTIVFTMVAMLIDLGCLYNTSQPKLIKSCLEQFIHISGRRVQTNSMIGALLLSTSFIHSFADCDMLKPII